MTSVGQKVIGTLGSLVHSEKDEATAAESQYPVRHPDPEEGVSEKGGGSAPSEPKRPSITRLPSQVLESDDSASLQSMSPPSISFSPTIEAMADTPTFSRTSTIEMDEEDGPLSGATTPLRGSRDKTSLTASTSSTGSASPSTVEGYKRHRRGWSQSASKEVKETLDATSSEDAATGTRTLNQYELGDELGKGSFGYVWRAVDTSTGQEYAIKEFSKSRLRRYAQAASMRAARRRGARSPKPEHKAEDGLRLIEHEVAIHKKLRHINVIALKEVIDDRTNDSIYMVLEICKGGPIMHVTTTEVADPMPESLARSYFRQVLLAVEYLHHLDICHQDIKPENILLSTSASNEDNLIKLCDFGVSQLFAKEGDDLSSRNAGSPAFLSPELNITQHGQLHQRASDIWSLGVTLYAMLTGRLPFRSTNVVEMATLIKSEPAVIPRALSPEARDILSKMLEKDPKTRVGIDELREHPWVTENGAIPLPSTEENCSPITDTSPEDLESALRSLSTVASAVRVAQRIKRMAVARRVASSDGRHPAPQSESKERSSSSVSSYHDDQHVESIRFAEDQAGVEFKRSEEISAARTRSHSASSAEAA